ncbi:polygalacturonase-like isoform X3 [Pistacia vera]|uniref:polygalacturonase-like isoform X3 n=1 Tax=Pistacia vera TaxID=55513 RepID=UPI001263BC94|nr:polygalacturonase-like isoform X3 [Pistacia vera]
MIHESNPQIFLEETSMAESKPDASHTPSDVKSPNILERAKEEIEAIGHHDKSPRHTKETHGTSDDIDESTPVDEVKAPGVFQRFKEEIQALVQAVRPKKESSSYKSSSNRPFAPNDALPPAAYQPGQNPLNSDTKMNSKQGTKNINEEAYSKIGSTPPSCVHKCYGCIPCEAIQVPTTSKHKKSHYGIQYANYEPEGWKCKCGPSFYSP